MNILFYHKQGLYICHQQYSEYMCNYVLNISENYGEYISDYAIYPLYKYQENIIIGIKNILVEPLIYIGIDLDFKYKKEP